MESQCWGNIYKWRDELNLFSFQCWTHVPLCYTYAHTWRALRTALYRALTQKKIEEYCVQIEWTENLTRAFIHRVTGTIWRRKNIYSGFRYIPLSGRPSTCVARMCCVCVWCLRTAYINCGDSLFHNNHQRIYCGKVITQRNRRLIIPNKIWIIFSLVKTSYHLLRIASNWGTFFSYTYLRQ